MMTSTAQIIKDEKLLETKCTKKAAIHTLYNELAKGIESMQKGNVYSIEDAWEEIDKI